MYRIYDIINSNGTELTQEKWEELRKKAQNKVLSEAPKDVLGKYRDPEAKKAIRPYVAQVVENELPSLPYKAREEIINRLVNEIHGYGVLEPLLDNPNITEIIVERYDKIIIEENGELKPTDIKFDSEEHLLQVIERILSPLGKRVDWSSPMVDARLPDGSRVNAVIPPIAVDGTNLTIRKFRPNVSMDDLVRWGMLSESIREGLKACVRGRLNIIVSGGTGSGKTTFLNALSEYIPHSLSIITIENPAELQLNHPHVRRWEARPPNIEGKGEVDMMSLVINALRSRPDIIIVGEVRGRESHAMLQAMNTGHPGSMTTLHANNTAQAMDRLVTMVASAKELPKELVPGYIAETIDLIIHVERMADGKRRLKEIAEVVGEENGKIKTKTLVQFKVHSIENGIIKGDWEVTGEEFDRAKVLKERGVDFPGF